MTNAKAIKKIADHYGINAQVIQAVEELAELTLELLNIRKYGVNYERRESLAEELADAEIMIDQIKHLYRLTPKVKEYRAAKIERQLARIAKEC